VPIITVTITPSSTETVKGIPDTLTVSTNIPATIFYTLDGTIPDINAAVYVAPIILPQYLAQITLNVFATNGVNNSSVITQIYTADLTSIITTVGDRTAQATVSDLGNANSFNTYPFGDTNTNPNFNYQANNPDNTIYNQNLPAEPTTFDSNGNPAGFTNQPLNPLNQIATTSTFNGVVFPGVGDKTPVDVIGKNSPVEYTPEISSKADRIFNPKALVIYQNTATDDPSNPVIINRSAFSLENAEIVKDGILLNPGAPDYNTITGSFIRRSYNPNTQMLTNYYFDGKVNRWVISSSPYTPTTPNVNSLNNIVFGRNSDKVFQWVTFAGRVLPG
jgi:Fn3 associated